MPHSSFCGSVCAWPLGEHTALCFNAEWNEAFSNAFSMVSQVHIRSTNGAHQLTWSGDSVNNCHQFKFVLCFSIPCSSYAMRFHHLLRLTVIVWLQKKDTLSEMYYPVNRWNNKCKCTPNFGVALPFLSSLLEIEVPLKICLTHGSSITL